MIAQNPQKHPGSIIRIKTDGTIPTDNPAYLGFEDWLPEIYQIGIVPSVLILIILPGCFCGF